MTNPPPDTATRVHLPPAGGAVFVTVLGTIVVFFVGVAVFNLWHASDLPPTAIVASLLWLFLVGVLLAIGIADSGGVRRWFVDCLGAFSRTAFIEVDTTGDAPVMLRFGFELLGREFDSNQIELARIGMISWSAGQASGMSGRDRNDWAVAVWHWKPGRSGQWDLRVVQDKHLIIVTPNLRKEDAAAVGRSILELLSAAGLRLVPGGEENDFIVVDAMDNEAQIEPSSPLKNSCWLRATRPPPGVRRRDSPYLRIGLRHGSFP